MSSLFGFALGFLLFLFWTAPWLGYCLAVRPRDLPLSAKLLLAVAFALAQLGVSGIILQYCSFFSSATWIVFNLAITAGACLAVRRSAERTAALEEGWAAFAKEFLKKVADFARGQKLQLPIYCLLVAFALLRAILVPETVSDSFRYHIIKAVLPFLQGDLPHLAGYPLVEGYPPFGEIWSSWWVQFPGGMTLNSAGSFFLYLYGSLAVYAVSRRLNAERRFALLAANCFLVTPMMVAQGTSGYVDLAAAAPILATFAVLPRGRRDLLFCSIGAGVLLGLAIGTRYNQLAAIPMVVVTHFVNGWLRVREEQEAGSKRRFFLKRLLLQGLLPLTLASLLIGGHTYIKNWLLYDNPVYPNALKMGPINWQGPYGEQRNASGAYMGLLHERFKAKSRFEQLWDNLRDDSNFHWHRLFWAGFVRPWWGNVMLWALLPATLFTLLFSRRGWMAVLVCWAALFVASIPFAGAAPRFHLLAGLLLYPSIGLAGTALAQGRQSWAASGFTIFVVAAILVPNAAANVGINFARNYFDSVRNFTGDPSAFKIKDPAILAGFRRKPGVHLTVGPTRGTNEFFYMFQREKPTSSPVNWIRTKPFEEVREDLLEREETDLVICYEFRNQRRKGWCSELAKYPRDFVLLWKGEDYQLYRRVKEHGTS